ncbi:Ppx/GppA phosphatase family protein [Geoalkalibacter sp.]|uniref:Ppx/GppA phosphatase family protein n=1 Tax=Geoalkalibacter sp. TaxID=3041440 RepID=UPI00272ECA05|nr:Ppx/GppA phosphatase family protein [Geoalkalibacter sp.]
MPLAKLKSLPQEPPVATPAPRENRRLAAIDIGTNSIRSIVVEARPGRDFQVLDDEKATVRLGEGLAASGEICPAAWERARDALARMLKIQQGYGVSAVEAVATSAVRQARNGAAFVAAIQDELGLAIEVISGEEEAELAFLSARSSFEMDNLHYALVDIGGGSAEIITTMGSQIEDIFSLDLGAVVLTEKFLPNDPISPEEHQRLRKHIRATLKKNLRDRDSAVQCLIGSGGTLTTIAAMVMAQRREQFNSFQGYEVLRSEVVHLLAMLLRKPLRERRAVSGLAPERADIIIAGMTVVDELMRRFGTNILKVNERGIRHGLILRSLEKYGLAPRARKPVNWRTAVLSFARACHFHEDHADQVARLSLSMFDALAPSFELDSRQRRLLEAAALLHDVGYFINYARHHKHSYHLIRHASLFGFSPREQEIIANIARYHRRALPKKNHENLLGLSGEDRRAVARLGGILRLADGLDRRRSRVVQSIACRLDGERFHVHLGGAEDLSVEIYGGESKRDLFEATFARKLALSAD